MKKKLFSLLLACMIILLLPAHANAESETLHKFVRKADNSLGYDSTISVPFYNGSSEMVTVPTEYKQPKSQFQSAWVATISNLNMAKPASETEFKENYLKTLKTFEEWNMNAMIFQVRPLLDAWYPSELNPWSEFLSGTQGKDPGYDPLAWMVDVTHQAGMEYHAWFNPYRVSNTKYSAQSVLDKTKLSKEQMLNLSIPEQIKAFSDAGILDSTNYAVKHPEHVLMFDEKFFLNPGIPEVQAYVIASMKEVVEKYDIDAIHFDDYFYPYRLSDTNYFGMNNEDEATFKTYGSGYTDIEEWRRDNITNLVSGIKTMLGTHNKEHQKAVQFGISPFGIWEHKAIDSRGSNTPLGSSKSYSNSIFADTYKWMKEGLIDYVTPQIYWSFDQAAAPYGELTRWWDNVAEGTNTHVYIGHANYKHVSNGGWDASWLNPEEVPNQMKFNQQYSNIKGSTLFSYNDILPSDINSLDPTLKERHQAKNDAIELLKSEYFNTPTLIPEKPWLSQQPINSPVSLSQVSEHSGTTLSWQDAQENSTRYFILYKGNGTKKEIIEDPNNIVKRIWKDQEKTTFSYTDSQTTRNKSAEMKYVVTAIDAAGVESEATQVEDATPETQGKPVTVIYQTNDQQPLSENVILEGKIGEAYTTEEKEFDGFKLVARPANVTGSFTDQPQTVTYIYESSTSTTTSESETNTSSSDSSQDSSSESSSTTQEANSTDSTVKPVGKSNLPSAGEFVSYTISILGVLLLVMIGRYVFLRSR
ncbi:family 10 glycosylhydrolase [Enterococcus ureasiticus]|nr:family 10 glycosylhydrolase [Enterococcus ureasiticus]